MEDYSSSDELDWFDGGFPEILGSSPALANDYSDSPSSLSPPSELAGDEDEDLDEDLDEELDEELNEGLEEEEDDEELGDNHTASEGTYDSDSFLDEFTVHGYSDSRSSLSHSDSEGGAEESPSQPSSQSSSHNARFDTLLEELARNDEEGDDGDEEGDIDIANFNGFEPRIIYTFRRTQTHDGDVTETEAFERRTDPRWVRRTVHHNRLGPPAFEAQHSGADISARARLPNLRRHDYRHHPYPSAAPRAPPPLPHHNHNHNHGHDHDHDRHNHNHQRSNHHNHHHHHHRHHRVHSQESQAPHSDELADELVEMEVQRQANSGAGGRGRAQQHAVTIDLTNDDDSDNQLTLPNDPRFRRPRNPVQQPQQQSYNAGPSQNRNNVRRPNGLGHRTPSLSRSDGSLLGGGGGGARSEYIDLTSDSEDVIMSRGAARATAAPRRVESNRHQPIAIPDEEENERDLERDFEREFERELEREQERERERERMRIRERALPPMPFADAFNIGRLFNRLMTGRDEVEVQFLGQRQGLVPINQVVNPLAGNAPMLNYAANGFNNRPPTPRPEFEKPAAARAGFTRDTGEDLTLVCPGCEEELKYDPNSEDVNSTPARKPRTKKDREEHHFWAVKDCGHVYCKSCFDSRLKKAGGKNNGGKNASMVNHTFQFEGKKTVCAVPDCTSDVTAKAAWVGIFL